MITVVAYAMKEKELKNSSTLFWLNEWMMCFEKYDKYFDHIKHYTS